VIRLEELEPPPEKTPMSAAPYFERSEVCSRLVRGPFSSYVRTTVSITKMIPAPVIRRPKTEPKTQPSILLRCMRCNLRMARLAKRDCSPRGPYPMLMMTAIKINTRE
jgi:hypothetical protein